MSLVNLKEWCEMDEIVYSAETNEQYLQFAGYDFDKKNIQNISKMKFLVSKIFLRTFSEPRILLLSSIENISESLTKSLELKLRDLRGTKIKSRYCKFNGKILNWNNWRQFNSSENDNKRRKIVFDEFIKKTRYISPVINLRYKELKKFILIFQTR
ncbi:MAG TPA: hypothetical protein VJM74_07940 [Nitrososphaeraceae archaeon]|nr:hypothetical protein [Nitrososphaeraceae archaeon]